MKIVFIHGKYFNSWEAQGVGFIASYIKKNTTNIEISFYQGSFDSDDEIILGCREADIIGFSCTSPAYKYAVEMSKKIKQINPDVHIVMGGYHASALPVESLLEGIIDQVVVGEGEAAFLDIINGNREKIIYGRRMTFDELPWPDRKLIKNERNIGIAKSETNKSITSFQSHRGCIFRCKYCSDGHNKIMYSQKCNGKYIVSRPVKDVMDEIEYVSKEYSLDLIKFCDATWNIEKEYVKEFCAEKVSRNNAIPFYPNIHANIVDDEMFEMMKRANCYEIGLGVESGSPKILKQIGKGTTLDTIRKAISLAKKYDIKVRGYFILGMPDESEEDIIMTEKFADEIDIEEYGFTILCPYPGSLMYNENIDYLKNIDWSKTDEYRNSFWRTKYLSNDDLKKWQKYFVDKFSNKITWHNKKVTENIQ